MDVLCEALRYVKFVSPSSEFAFIFVCFLRLLAIFTAHNSGMRHGLEDRLVRTKRSSRQEESGADGA